MILAFALGGFGIAVSAQTKKPTVKSTGSVSGETYRYKYNQDDFAETPSWNGDEGEPPLPLSRALAIARANLPRFVIGAENFKMRSVMLRATGNDKWFYQFSFSCAAVTCRELPTRQFALIVKMDGTILEPKRIVEVD